MRAGRYTRIDPGLRDLYGCTHVTTAMGKGKPKKAAKPSKGGVPSTKFGTQHAVSKKQKKRARKLELKQKQHASASSPSSGLSGGKSTYHPQALTLLLGEGDFSFAAALALTWKDASNLVATAFDEEELALAKYKGIVDNIETVRSLGGTVLFGVDATRCHSNKALKRYQGRFERIVFNFPHLGSGMKDQARNVKQHQELLRGTCLAARPLLAPPPRGELHFTLKKGEPYESWSLVTIAKMCKLRVRYCNPFMPDKYPGYAHRRSIGDEHAGDASAHEPNAEISGARTFAFAPDE